MRAIDADGLAKAVKERVGLETGIGREINEGMIVAYAMIAMAPTLTIDDLRPKGRWLHRENGVAYCSECEMDAVEDGTNFCPECGADMRGDGEDG